MTRSILAAAITSFAALSASVSAAIVINEVDSDTPGTDAAEFIELFNTDLSNSVNLAGLVLVFFNGTSDLSYLSLDLAGTITAGGYFVIGNAGVANVSSITFAGNTLQNGADAIALYTGTAAAFPTNTAVTSTNLLDAVVYDTADADDSGLLVLTPGQPQINEDQLLDPATVSIGRFPDGSGGALNTSSYVVMNPTPGTANIPEPTTVLTLMSGLGMLGIIRRRSRRA